MRNLILLLAVCLAACTPSVQKDVLIQNDGKAQGTFYHISYLAKKGTDYHPQIDSILKAIDNSLSTWVPTSLISRINKGEDLPVDPMFEEVFLGAKAVYEASNGHFDCTIGPLANAWGFGFSEKEKMDSARVKELLQLVGFDKVNLVEGRIVKEEGVMFDFNAIAQGYSVDLLARFLEDKGVNQYLVELGGELKTKGKNAEGKLWRIGVDKPTEELDRQDRFQFILDLNDKSLATSGNYRKFYVEDGVKYSHTLSPFSGYPARNTLLSATVIHDVCMLADAYATAFMVMGLEDAKAFLATHPELEGYFVYSDEKGEWQTFISERLQGRIVE